jgi:hypothetical protein
MNNEVKKLKEAIEIARLMAHGQKVPPTETEKEKLDIKAEREKELERSEKEWDQYFRDNQGKIKRDWPSYIFDY